MERNLRSEPSKKSKRGQRSRRGKRGDTREAVSACVVQRLEPRVLLSALPPFQATDPLGSLTYRSDVQDAFAAASETDSFTFSVDAGQTITIVAEPLAGTLNLDVALKDPSAAVVAQGNTRGVN